MIEPDNKVSWWDGEKQQWGIVKTIIEGGVGGGGVVDRLDMKI